MLEAFCSSPVRKVSQADLQQWTQKQMVNTMWLFGELERINQQTMEVGAKQN